ncbi:hypothetical protein EI555_002532, partial [Monodon monoceros]
GDCEFLVQRARELVQQDLWAAKAWLITACSLYPANFNIQVYLKLFLVGSSVKCYYRLRNNASTLWNDQRFPETVVQHGVSLGEALLEAETIEEQESPVNCFRKLFVCDVLPLIINNHDILLSANLVYKYLNKAAEFNINYVTRSTQIESQHQGAQETSDLMLFKILNVVGTQCDWQMDKGRRSYGDILHRMKELCRYMNNFDNEAHAKYKNQSGLFRYNAFQCVNSTQQSLFQGPNAPSQAPLVLLQDISNVYGDRKLAERREKPMSSDDEDCSAKGRNRHIAVNKAELANSIEVLESFKLARQSWELLYSLEFLDKEFTRICLTWKTDTWLWLRIFLNDMIIYPGQYKKAIASLHHLAALQLTLIQLATFHFALGEYRMTCEKDGGKSQEERSKIKPKFRKGSYLKLLPCTSKAIMPYCLHLIQQRRHGAGACDRAASAGVAVGRDPLFLKAVNKICQQGNFQYENFFNYVTNINMLEEFTYLKTQEGGKIHLEL